MKIESREYLVPDPSLVFLWDANFLVEFLLVDLLGLMQKNICSIIYLSTYWWFFLWKFIYLSLSLSYWETQLVFEDTQS